MRGLSVMDYCSKVQQQVLASEPAKDSPLFDEWFFDTGRVSRAVSYASECKNSKALEIAERLARRYGYPD